MEIGKLFQKSWESYKKTFAVWLLLGLWLSFLPQSVFSIIAAFSPEEFPPAAIAVGFVLFLVLVFFTLWYNASLIAMMKDAKRATEVGLRKVPRFFLLSVLIMLIMTGILVALALPALAFWAAESKGGAIAAGIVALLAFVVFSTWLGIKLLFSAFALVLDDKGVIESMKASWNMVAGRFWQVFLLFLVLIAISIAFGTAMGIITLPFAIGSAVFEGMGQLAGVRTMDILGGILSAAGTVFFTPFYIAFLKHAYDGLKR